jgi:transketolase
VFKVEEKGIATRKASGKVLNAIASKLPQLIGGSADLSPSTDTMLEKYPSFSAEDRTGRNFHFGIREHAMGSVLNGMALTKRDHPIRCHISYLLRIHAAAHTACSYYEDQAHYYFYPR